MFRFKLHDVSDVFITFNLVFYNLCVEHSNLILIYLFNLYKISLTRVSMQSFKCSLSAFEFDKLQQTIVGLSKVSWQDHPKEGS